MSMRGSSMMHGDRRESLDDPMAGIEQENLSDDDNAQPDIQEAEVEVEDPLVMAIDDLEGRVVSALDSVKMHPGIRSSSAPGSPNVHEELATLLRPVIEVAAHTGPSVARTYYRGEGHEGIETSVEDVYERVVSDLVLPVMLEMAQSERNPAKLGASLEFFRNLWKECHKAGSWLDNTTTGPQAGPYGAGGSHSVSASTPAMRAMNKRRQAKRLAREGELLRYWVQASIACTEPGVLTSDKGEGAVASRGIIAASSSIRPSLRHIAQRIRDTDDRGANRLYAPVMKMVEGVLKQLFLGSPGESIRSASLKFLEIVILCCSSKPKDSSSGRHKDPSSRRRGQATQTGTDFSLDDLPAGHPIITREALESIAEYAFTTLRGLALLGGQVKIDASILSDILLTSGGGGSPSAQVVTILKPAALAYMEIESNLKSTDENAGDVLEYSVDRSRIEFDFQLSQKSYALTINAMSALAVNRPTFFKESVICLCRRAVQPPTFVEGGHLTKAAVLAVVSQLKSSCLTLLRNVLSVATNSYDILHRALKTFDMEIQADKALSMARKMTALQGAGRNARNAEKTRYEWEVSDSDRVSRRQRETDDALASMRAAKAKRGLGHGIQLPTSMSDGVELILANLLHLPSKRPQVSADSKPGKAPVSLDSVIDAVMTNGASLSHAEGHWYERDGAPTWTVDMQSQQKYSLEPKFLETLESLQQEKTESEGTDEREAKRRKVFVDQSQTAASGALSRILAASTNTRSSALGQLGSNVTARLAFVLQGSKPSSAQKEQYEMARESAESVSARLTDPDLSTSLARFIDTYPLVAAALAVDGTASSEAGAAATKGDGPSLGEAVLNEALLQSCTTGNSNDLKENTWKYDCALVLYIAIAVHAGELSNDKPSDADRKNAAASATARLQVVYPRLPRLSEASIKLICSLVDIEEITKKASAAQRKTTSQESIAASAATHAAKVAAEKRAIAALLILRDVAFQRDASTIRKCAVECAVGIASSRLPSSPSIQEKALKLVMNVFFTKSELFADLVADAVMDEIERASKEAVGMFDAIEKSNLEAETNKDSSQINPLAPRSDEEKKAMERMRRPAVLCMALCIRRPELVQKLFALSSVEKADVLSKTVRVNMGKLTKAIAAKHGATDIALKVAEMTGPGEVPMLLSFLENLAPSNDRSMPEQDIIDACFKIQELKKSDDGKKDPRFIIPVVSAMLREDLVSRLSEFVAADDKVFLGALVRMGDRVARQALLFREEMDDENPTLRGMTLCEQLVFLHRLDFAAVSLPQKRYLAAIKLCLGDEEVYNDRVVMSALDQMSGVFLTGAGRLPLAFMRTCIIVCSQHESLHSWICNELLPRLIDGKIYEDPRQWEGWMRCAHMLENSVDPSVSSTTAINKLPPEQLMQYRTKWEGK